MGSPWVPETSDGDLVGRQVHGVLRAQQDAVGDAEQAEGVGDLGEC